ncbi:MAG: MocR-like pyridoxine biosynthesis transcription factor PdxR [Thermoleophilaceae bacterium]
MDETSQPLDLLISVSRSNAQTLGAQIEDQLRCAIREGSLRPGARVPSTRDLARQLGISRRVAVDAYSQLAAEGYLVLRQGARPAVSDTPALACAPSPAPERVPQPRVSFKPAVPDVSTFPRTAWLRALREALAEMTDADLGYGDVRGVDLLRETLADYLGRVRGVVAEPSRILITSGYWQGLGLVCGALAGAGARRLAHEDPCHPDVPLLAERARLEPVAIPVDDAGVRVDVLAASGADAVSLTPAHQDPTGVVLSGERRTAVLTWLRERGTIAIEDDYDAEYRYDRTAVGALQGLEPDRVVYAGSASKTLAPALRLGWLVVPPGLLDAVTREKALADQGSTRIEQYALAKFIQRGELDRHLRRMRVRYRARRDTLVAALQEELPEAMVCGVAAGLHAVVELPGDYDEAAILAEARERGIELGSMRRHRADPSDGPPALLLGYAQLPEAAIGPGVRELAKAVRATRR